MDLDSKSTWTDVDLSLLGLMSSGAGRVDVDRSRHEPMSSVVSLGRSRPVLARADFWSQPVSMSSEVCPGRFLPESTRADVDLGRF